MADTPVKEGPPTLMECFEFAVYMNRALMTLNKKNPTPSIISEEKYKVDLRKAGEGFIEDAGVFIERFNPKHLAEALELDEKRRAALLEYRKAVLAVDRQSVEHGSLIAGNAKQKKIGASLEKSLALNDELEKADKLCRELGLDALTPAPQKKE